MLINSKKYKQKGFSIAEAMISLLIISIALAAAAPLMTKKMKSNIAALDSVSVVRQENNTNNNIRIWSNGYKEVWMNTTSDATGWITLPISFNNTSYYALVSNSKVFNLHPIVQSKETNRVRIVWREGGGRNNEYGAYDVVLYISGY